MLLLLLQFIMFLSLLFVCVRARDSQPEFDLQTRCGLAPKMRTKQKCVGPKVSVPQGVPLSVED